LSWEQLLCSLLLYVQDPQTSLLNVLKLFVDAEAGTNLTKVNNSGKEDLMFSLLKVYACIDGSIDCLRTFHNVSVTPETSKFHEHHLQWLVQYVLRLYANHENQLDAEENHLAALSRKIGVVESRDFDVTTT